MAEIDRELKELKVKYNVGKPGSTAGVGDLKVGLVGVSVRGMSLCVVEAVAHTTWWSET